MPSHFSTIGIPVNSGDEFTAVAERVAPEARTYSTRYGKYLCWDSGVGVELWLQASPNDELIGMNPHFSGTARMRAGLTANVTREEHTALDGAWHAWADPGGEMGTDGCYPFVFDVPDFHLNKFKTPKTVELQLAAFAHELQCFENETAFDAAGKTGEPRFAVESFIPAGLFEPGSGSINPPLAHAIFTGRILETERRINPLSGDPFYWALTKTPGGQIDVVADPELITTPMVKGGVLTGSFWLSGRIVSEEKRGFLGNLFGR